MLKQVSQVLQYHCCMPCFSSQVNIFVCLQRQPSSRQLLAREVSLYHQKKFERYPYTLKSCQMCFYEMREMREMREINQNA